VKKFLASIILLTIAIQPTLEPKHNTLKTFALGFSIFSLGTIAASTTAYKTARHRRIKTKPAKTNFKIYGNKNGQPVIYSHGLSRYYKDALAYTKEKNDAYIFDKEKFCIATFNFPDVGNMKAKNKNDRFVYEHVSLGQEKDICRLEKAIKRFNRTEIIGFGLSRGASTLINFAGSKKLTHNKLIKALVLESPYSTTKSAIKHISKHKKLVRHVPFMGGIAQYITQNSKRYTNPHFS
jgi:hypothetical protein